MNYLNGDQEVLHDTIYFDASLNDVEMSIALQYANKVMKISFLLRI